MRAGLAIRRLSPLERALNRDLTKRFLPPTALGVAASRNDGEERQVRDAAAGKTGAGLGNVMPLIINSDRCQNI